MININDISLQTRIAVCKISLISGIYNHTLLSVSDQDIVRPLGLGIEDPWAKGILRASLTLDCTTGSGNVSSASPPCV